MEGVAGASAFGARFPSTSCRQIGLNIRK